MILLITPIVAGLSLKKGPFPLIVPPKDAVQFTLRIVFLYLVFVPVSNQKYEFGLQGDTSICKQNPPKNKDRSVKSWSLKRPRVRDTWPFWCEKEPQSSRLGKHLSPSSSAAERQRRSGRPRRLRVQRGTGEGALLPPATSGLLSRSHHLLGGCSSPCILEAGRSKHMWTERPGGTLHLLAGHTPWLSHRSHLTGGVSCTAQSLFDEMTKWETVVLTVAVTFSSSTSC
jgi:hypothetical protein